MNVRPEDKEFGKGAAQQVDKDGKAIMEKVRMPLRSCSPVHRLTRRDDSTFSGKLSTAHRAGCRTCRTRSCGGKRNSSRTGSATRGSTGSRRMRRTWSLTRRLPRGPSGSWRRRRIPRRRITSGKSLNVSGHFLSLSNHSPDRGRARRPLPVQGGGGHGGPVGPDVEPVYRPERAERVDPPVGVHRGAGQGLRRSNRWEKGTEHCMPFYPNYEGVLPCYPDASDACGKI